MKKITTKFLKILMLISMIFSSLQTPIQVFASEINTETEENINKGSIRIDDKVSETGTVSTSVSKDGITVTKTVSTIDATNGKYKVKFEVKGEEKTQNRPVYIVVVFDKSASMGSSTKWTEAVKGAKTFAKEIVNNISTSKLALVTFSTYASTTRDFAHIDFENANNKDAYGREKNLFGSSSGGTNLQAGLIEAKGLLDKIPEEDKDTALKYVVVMSDGEPTLYNSNPGCIRGYNNICGVGDRTDRTTLEKTLSAAKDIKDNNGTIFSIGYSLVTSETDYNGNVTPVYAYEGDYTYNGTTIKDAKLTTADILKLVATKDDTSSTIKHFVEAKEEGSQDSIVNVFKKVATSILYPGFNATLSDTVGPEFRIINQDGTFSNYGAVKTSQKIDTITKEVIDVLEFDIQIDKDTTTGWHKTNNGFTLKYYDSNKKEYTISSEKDPEVYWIQNTYKYIVNYYKDSLQGTLLKSEERYAPKGTVINKDNVEINKYLDKAGAGYSFNTITPDSITISNDGSVKEINIVYKAKGTVKATYTLDTITGRELAKSETSKGLGGESYTTIQKEIYGYSIKEVIGQKDGKYLPNEEIVVNYIYTKNQGEVKKDELSKTQINNIAGADSEFSYVLTYNGKIENYDGDVTITLIDTLPYDVKEIKYDTTQCSFNQTTRELTCKKTVSLSKEVQDINVKFDVIVKYNNLTSKEDLEVKNVVKSTLTYGSKHTEKEATREDTISSSKVTAIYVDESDNKLSASVETTGLIDNDYETTAKEIYGYELKEVIGEEKGKYTKEEITVKYIYKKLAGKVTENKVTKQGPAEITSVNDTFNYTLSYNGKIEDYVGDAKLTITDTLPYEIDEELSNYSNNNACVYDIDNLTITCTSTHKIDASNKEVKANYNLSLVFKNIDKDNVTNKVTSLLTYENNQTPSTDETETKVLKGTVIATYKDTKGNPLAKEVELNGYAGTNYETNELEFLGYTLSKVPTNKNGEIIANETIYVNYVYDKNIGTSEEELTKIGLEKVSSIDSAFEYTITYNTQIKDYVGDVKIIIEDILPYEIDEEKSSLGNVCKYTSGKLVCEYNKTINNADDANILIEENITLYFKAITSKLVINQVKSTLIYGQEEKVNEDATATEVAYGTLFIKYVDESGKDLADTITKNELVGTKYKTNKLAIDGYYLKEVIGEEEGKYTEEDTEVTYVYSLIPLPPQTGYNIPDTNYVGLLIGLIVVMLLTKKINI